MSPFSDTSRSPGWDGASFSIAMSNTNNDKPRPVAGVGNARSKNDEPIQKALLQIYQRMLPNNPDGITFLFDPAFAAAVQDAAQRVAAKYGVTEDAATEELRRLLAIKTFTADTDAIKIGPTALSKYRPRVTRAPCFSQNSVLYFFCFMSPSYPSRHSHTNPGHNTVDELWLAAVVDTWFYADLSEALGLFLHHRPAGSSSQETERRQKRLETMETIYLAFFSAQTLGSPPPRSQPEPEPKLTSWGLTPPLSLSPAPQRASWDHSPGTEPEPEPQRSGWGWGHSPAHDWGYAPEPEAESQYPSWGHSPPPAPELQRPAWGHTRSPAPQRPSWGHVSEPEPEPEAQRPAWGHPPRVQPQPQPCPQSQPWAHQQPWPVAAQYPNPLQQTVPTLIINVVSEFFEFPARVLKQTTVARLRRQLQHHTDASILRHFCMHDGVRLREEETMESAGIKEGDVVQFIRDQNRLLVRYCV